jgi:2'-5' RNA ligase
MRLFVGIPLGTQVLGELMQVVNRLRLPEDGLRWTAPATWHITLQFLGEASGEQYESLLASLCKVEQPKFSVKLETLGGFERSGVFIVSVQLSLELLALQKSVLAATGPCGFQPETRPYQPHITLARSRVARSGLGSLTRRLQAQTCFSACTATEFLLYESFLGPGGARYEVRGRFPLKER